MSVLLPKNIDVSKLKYSEVKVLKSGAKSVYVNHDGAKLLVQTPVLNIPYGINDNSKFIKDDEKKDDDKKYDLVLSFKGIAENPKIKLFHDKLKQLEEKIIEDAFANRQLWFKNNFNNNKDVVSTMFTPMVKLDKDKNTGEIANKYPPTFKVKIPYNTKENKFEFDAYDMDNNDVEFADILNNLKGGKAQLIIQLNGIWFAGGMFGCSWKIVSGKFQQSNSSKITFVVDSDVENNDDEEDDDDISVDEDVIKKVTPVTPVTSVTQAPQAPAKKEEKKAVVVEDVEEEEEDHEEPEPEEEEDTDEAEEEEERPPTPPPEPPKPVKKAVKKTAK